MDREAVSSEICDALTSVKTLLEESKVLFKESSKPINTGQFPEELNSTSNISGGCNTRETLPNEPSEIPPLGMFRIHLFGQIILSISLFVALVARKPT